MVEPQVPYQVKWLQLKEEIIPDTQLASLQQHREGAPQDFNIDRHTDIQKWNEQSRLI
jgi:hypothetical protein